MVVDATFNNISVISWQYVLLVKETEYPEKISDLPQVTNNVVSITPRLGGIRTHNFNGDRH
jgi:hypothetical protein